jgi:hypothetical protein
MTFSSRTGSLKLRVVGDAGEIVKLVAQHIAGALQLILHHQRAVALELQDIGENLIDGGFQAGFGCQRRGGIVFLAGHHVIARQCLLRNQLSVDIAGKIGFRDAVPMGGDRLRNMLEAEMGGAEAGGRDGEHDGKAELDFGRNPKLGSHPVSDRGQARFDIPTPDSTLSSGKPMGAGTHGAPPPVGKVRAQWTKGGKFG